MAPEFALFLSPDGIALAHRQSAGHWAVLGDTALDVPDLPGALAAMRKLGENRAAPGFATLVMLPDDQILFTSLTAPGPEEADRLEQIQAGLDGLTPYAVQDLAFDHVALEDGRVKLAVVARETLAEAEGFAREHGFEPVGFAARPLDNRYPGVAHFDRSPDWTAAITDIEFGHDNWHKPDTGADVASPQDARAEEIGKDEADPAADAPAKDSPEPGIAAADRQPDIIAPAAGEEASAPEPAPDLSLGDGPADAPAAAEAPRQDDPESAPPDRSDRPGADAAAAPDEPLQMPPGFGAGRPRDGAAAGDAAERVSSRPSRLAMGATDTPPSPTEMARKPDGREKGGPARPRFGRGKSKPAASADAAPTRPAAAGPAPDLPPLTRTKLRLGRKRTEAETTPPPRPAQMPAPTAAPSSAPAAEGDARPSARDRLSDMGKRLSAGAGKARDTAAGLAAKRRADGAPDRADATDTAGIGSITARLKTLARKDRPADRATRAATEARAPADIARPAADAIAPPPPRRPRSPAAKRSPAPVATDAGGALASGLLGRGKRPENRGPSLRAGLILTLILLAVLGLIAIWAVFYLPDTALARWLGMGPQEAAIEQADGPPQVPEIPALPTAPSEASDPGPDLANVTPEAAAPQTPGQAPQAPDLLPDIDADLDLGPAPVAEPRIDPETLLPSVAEAEDFYARTGIWQRPPVIELPVPETTLGDVLLAGLDPPVTSVDAYALPVPRFNPAEDLPRRQSSPVDPETAFVFDENGLVVPTPEGTLNPDGILIIAGAPVLTPPQRPGDAPAASAAPDAGSADPTAGAIDTALLGTRRPTGRPDDLQEERERALLGGITFAELGQIRPRGRPASIQEIAAAEAANDRADAAADTAEITTTSEWAVAVSFVPRARPGNIDEIVTAARAAAGTGAVASTAPAGAGAVAPVAARPTDTVQPDIPSSASVTRAATRENAINLHRINLIGVTGTDSNRRALVRLPSGRFVTVGAGDRLDGGQVAAIGDRTLQYVKSGRTITLELPAG